MTETTDLCDRLIDARDNYGMLDDLPDLLQDASDEIKRLRAALLWVDSAVAVGRHSTEIRSEIAKVLR